MRGKMYPFLSIRSCYHYTGYFGSGGKPLGYHYIFCTFGCLHMIEMPKFYGMYILDDLFINFLFMSELLTEFLWYKLKLFLEVPLIFTSGHPLN